MRECGGTGQASSLQRRQMLAHSIDLGNRRPGVHQRLVGGNHICQRDIRMDGLLGDGRSSAANEVQDQGLRRWRIQQSENGIASAQRVSIGKRMTTDEIAKAEKLRGGRRRSRNNSGEAGAHDAGERLRHGVARFADGNHQSPEEASEIVKIAADAEVIAIVLQVAAEGSRDAALSEGVLEHVAHAFAHFAEYSFRCRLGGHVGRL